ncbi:MAG: transaldolase family protein [Bryobacteraceae bacterium]
MSESVIERLVKTNSDMEVWWDSSPLIFDKWAAKMVNAAPDGRKAELQAQLRRLFNSADPASSVVRGCTTNPPLSLEAVKADPEFWNARIDELIEENPRITSKELFWGTYKLVVKKGAEMFRPMNQASNGRFGWVSGQLDPRLFTEKTAMYRQADELAALQPNVMIKVPASTEGVDVVRHLTSKGISTNVTTCFTVSQVLAVARAAREGLQLAMKAGVNTSRWRAVITLMMGRLSERKNLIEQAEYRGIHITEADRKWFGIAAFKRCCQLLRDGGYPSKMLLCSVRPGPLVNGKMRFWDVEEFAGGDIVYTLPPYGLEPLFALGDDIQFCPSAIHRPVPQASIDKIMQIPYGIQGLDPNGLSLDQFNSHPATVLTVAEFSKAANGLEEYVANRLAMSAEPGREPVLALPAKL